FFSSRRRHTRFSRDWSSDVCSSDLKSATTLEMSLISRSASLKQEYSDGRGPCTTRCSPSALDSQNSRCHSAVSPAISSASEAPRSEERRVGEESRESQESRKRAQIK